MSNLSEPRKRWKRLLITSAAVAVAWAFYLGVDYLQSDGLHEAKLRQIVLNDPANAAARMDLASMLAEKEEWAEAVSVLEDEFEQAPDDMDLERALAQIYGDWAAASEDEEKLEQALAHAKIVVDSGKATSADFMSLGKYSYDAGEYRQAAGAYDKAFELEPKDGDARWKAHYARLSAGKYEEARDFFNSVVATDPNNGAAFLNLGQAQYYLGNYEEAVKSLQKSVELSPKKWVADRENQLQYARRLASKEKSAENFEAHVDMADWHNDRDRTDRAVAEYEAALAVSAARDSRAAWANFVLGQLYLHLYEFEKTEGYLQEAISIAREIDDWSTLSYSYQFLGDLYGTLSEIHADREVEYEEKSLKAHELQLEMCKNIGDKQRQIDALAHLTKCHLRLCGLDCEQTKKYRAELTKHLPAPDAEIEDPAIFRVVSTECDLRYEEKDYAGAEKLLLQMIKSLWFMDQEGDPSAYAKLAILATRTNQYDKGIHYALEGIRQLSGLRTQMGTDSFRQKVGGGLWAALFGSIIECAAKKGDSRAVFNYSEEYKARALAELLGTKAGMLRTQDMTLARTASAEAPAPAETPVSGNAPTAGSASRDLTIEENRYKRLPEDSRVAGKQVPNYETVEALDAAAVQAMAEGFTFISYDILYDSSLAIVLSHDSIDFVWLPDATEKLLHDKVDKFRNGLGIKAALQRDLTVEAGVGAEAAEDGRDAALRESLQQLYDGLIAPVRPYIKTDLVYVSCDGILNYVPFEALQNDGRYLIEDYAIAYAPSATVLKQCMDMERHGRSSVLALGNPNLQNPAFRLINAEEEVQALSALFEKADVLTGDAANERAVQERAGQYDVLHFACHGELNLDDPMLTSLRLSPDGENDGYLHAGEVFDLDLWASLVVLSACNSGVGELYEGNELMGLTRSFLYAGAPSIIASLWTVDDRSTAFLMREFYKNLGSMNKAEALRQAKLATMKQYPSPFHWAAFCLQGDYRN